MVVLFALLVVALVGAAVLIAVRFPQAGQLPEVVPDQPVAQVPAAGALTADDLRRVRFPVVFRGYRMADVDALLDRLADQRAASPPAPGTPPPQPYGDASGPPAASPPADAPQSPAVWPNSAPGPTAQWEATP